MRLTKIVATLGPATSNPEGVRGLVEAGASVVRLNCSHLSTEQLK
jgi:pyruvate kinase